MAKSTVRKISFSVKKNENSFEVRIKSRLIQNFETKKRAIIYFKTFKTLLNMPKNFKEDCTSNNANNEG